MQNGNNGGNNGGNNARALWAVVACFAKNWAVKKQKERAGNLTNKRKFSALLAE